MNAATLEAEEPPEDVAATLSEHRRSRRTSRLVAGVIALVVVIGAVVLWQFRGNRAAPVEYELAEVARGSIETTAAATGNLEPKRVVEIGAEISGLLRTVEVEANDPVTTGQVLATFDVESLENSLAQTRASVAAARADVRRAESALELARLALDRLEKLADSNSIAAREFDEARIAVRRAEADRSAAKAQLRLARTRLELAETNRQKAVIVSPIDGVVLQRNVEPGNTVASSFQAPVLFVIAEDLERMELQVAVDEADVGDVEQGDPATFTVDAWPGHTFEAQVQSVDLAPTITNSVVTYTAVLGVDNAQRLLRPGMTATATIVTGRKEDVIRVPNVAFGFRPSSAPAPVTPKRGLFTPGPPGRRRSEANRSSRKSVWVLRDGVPVEVSLATGRTDGQWTEVVEGDLETGEQLVIDEKKSKSGGELRS